MVAPNRVPGRYCPWMPTDSSPSAMPMRRAAATLAALVLVAACGATPGASTPPGPGSTMPAAATAAAGSATASAHASATPPGSGSPAAAIGTISARLSTVRLPVPLSRTVAFADGASILVCGGLTRTGTTGVILRLVPAAGTVVRVGHLATPVHDAAGALLGGSMILVGGGSVTQDSGVQQVSTSGHTTAIGYLPLPRADLGAVTVGNELIVLGGGANGGSDRRVLATTDGVRFRTIATLPVGVRYAAVALLRGRIYVFGGAAASGDVAAIQVVDVAAATARLLGRLPETLSHAAALVLDGRIFIAGGRHAGQALDSILAFDPATNRATPTGRLPRAMSDTAAVVIGRTGYLVGGEAGGLLASVVELVVTP
jgi:hypothetical protein